MKSRILHGLIWSIIACCAASPNRPAAAQARDEALLIPARALLYAHTAGAARVLPLASYALENLAGAGEGAETWIRDFKTRTGIDLLDPGSITRAGVDAARPAALAFVPGERGDRQIMILIPVTNESEAPPAFVKLVKQYHADKQGLDLNPAMVMHQGTAIYQMLTDVYFAGVDGCLLFANTDALIKEAIGLRAIDATASLAGDPVFRAYREQAAPAEDINVFIRGAFFRDAGGDAKTEAAPSIKQKKKKKRTAGGKSGGEVIEEDAPDARKNAMGALENSGIQGMDYVAAGLSRKGGAISLVIGAAPGKGTQAEQFIRTLFRPGLPANLLPAANPVAYLYCSLNLKSLDEACVKGQGAFSAVCEEYRKSLASFGKDSGIDLREDFIKRFDGYVNVAVRPATASGSMDGIALMLPLHDAEGASALWKKLKANGRKKNPGDRYGETEIGGYSAFWFLDERSNRLYALASGKQLYFSNDEGMLREVLSGGAGFFSVTGEESIKNLDASVFLAWYLNLRGESWLKAMLLLGSFSAGPQVVGVLNRLKTAAVIGRMQGQFVSIRMQVELSPAGAR
ncbi:MAG: hypothetical protein EPN93_00600 [Spirochaetes bacterium]|nr:MAG: hypothetical protein EPN93_00600 [Spirochaetota bacterium]